MTTMFIPPKTICTYDHHALAGLDLGGVHQLVTDLERQHARQDIVIPMKDVKFAFFEERAVAIVDGVHLPITRSAWGQMAGYLGVRGLGKLLAKTAALDSSVGWRKEPVQARQVASLMFRTWSQHVDQKLRFRLAYREMEDGQVRQVLDAVVSETYALLSHVETVELLIEHLGENRQVIGLDVSTTAMRLRLADEPLELGKPIKMFEAWNSETARHSLSVWAKLWLLACANGMSVTQTVYGQSRHVHKGDMHRRVGEVLPGRIIGMRRAMGETVVQYEDSKHVHFDWLDRASETGQAPVEVFLDQELARRASKIPDKVLKTIKLEGLNDPTSSPMGTLAGCVDAVTLIAQRENLEGQKFLEDIAADILVRGLKAADRERVLVSA